MLESLLFILLIFIGGIFLLISLIVLLFGIFKKSQKLLDRFLFIFFAEDGGLLPPNFISRMIERYEILIEQDAQKSLYEIFKQYFG